MPNPSMAYSPSSFHVIFFLLHHHFTFLSGSPSSPELQPILDFKNSSDTSYIVSRGMSKSEALLKVILSPLDSVADTYRELLPEGTSLLFQRILELRASRKLTNKAYWRTSTCEELGSHNLHCCL